MRAVLDPNVLVSALISTAGPPREIVAAWAQGRFELIASPALLAELRDVLVRPKFRRWVGAANRSRIRRRTARRRARHRRPSPAAGAVSGSR